MNVRMGDVKQVKLAFLRLISLLFFFFPLAILRSRSVLLFFFSQYQISYPLGV